MTAQIPDMIEYDGRRMRLSSYIPLPRKHARIRKVESTNPGGPLINSTACWRRYMALWKIREGKLYLTGFAGRYELTGGDPLFADWFSGEIRLSKLEAETYAHMRYVTRVEREIILRMENGVVVSVKGPRPSSF